MSFHLPAYTLSPGVESGIGALPGAPGGTGVGAGHGEQARSTTRAVVGRQEKWYAHQFTTVSNISGRDISYMFLL